jgi:Transcriptional regulator, AbiEi antitoxin
MHHYDEVLLTPGDLGVAALAQRQHGVVSTAQLHATGLGRGAIDLRVRRGRLTRLHRGVYAVGHARLTIRGRYWAALLACGGPGRAALSHRTAAAVWDLLPSPAGRYDVTTRRTGKSTPAIRVHRHRLEAQDIARQEDGLALTTPTRTLIDLADQLTPHQLTRACHRAEILRLLDARRSPPASTNSPDDAHEHCAPRSPRSPTPIPTTPAPSWNNASSPSSRGSRCHDRASMPSSRATRSISCGAARS